MAKEKPEEVEDSVDSVIHGIIKLQKEHWCVESLHIEYEYGRGGVSNRRIRRAATMVVKLVPNL